MENIQEVLYKSFGIVLFCIGLGMLVLLFGRNLSTLDGIERVIYENHVIRMR